MVNPNDPAFPEALPGENGARVQNGLTKREHFACELTKGLIASGDVAGLPEVFAQFGCRYADALIAELNKEAKP